jgi:hypothetical protein
MSSPFSGHAGRIAAIWAADQARAAQEQENQLIERGKVDALGAIDTGQASALDAINTGSASALDALTGGYGAAKGQYDAAIPLFQPYADVGKKALTQYADATGVNGQAGYDNATTNFRASPGYQYAVDQSTDQVARKASALGIMGSGNTMQAISDRAGHMADQDYSDYLSRLKGESDTGLQATGSMAALTKGIGDLDVGEGTAKAKVGMTAGSQIASLDSNSGAQRAGIFGNATGLGVNTLANTTQSVVNSGTQGLLAGQQAAANSWSAILGGLNLGAKLLGTAVGGGGIGSALSTLTGGFGGGMGMATPGESWT